MTLVPPTDVGSVSVSVYPQESFGMKRSVATTLLIVLAALVCSCSSGNPDSSNTQERFGVRMARMNLWREAMFRFKRAVEMNPEDAMARNNLAVALEANGDFDAAAKEYREAIRLDKTNQFIQKNYSRFVEFTTRNRRRQQQQQQRRAAAEAAAVSDQAPSQQPAGLPPASPGQQPAPQPPTGTAPAATPPPNPPPPQPPPAEKPPGGFSS